MTATHITIIGASPAGLSAAQQAVAMGMCVSLIDPRPMVCGLIHRSRLTGTVERLAEPYTRPRLTFFGNVPVGATVSLAEIDAHADSPDTLTAFFRSRRIPVTTWHGWHTLDPDYVASVDWEAVDAQAHAVPVCS